MTGEKVKEVCRLYVQRLSAGGLQPERNDRPDVLSRAKHVLWMALETRDLVDADRMEKAFRWLGFIQGWLWTVGIYTVDELKSHNMPTSEEFKR